MKPRTVTVSASITWHRPPAEPVTEWPWRSPWGVEVGRDDDIAYASRDGEIGLWQCGDTLIPRLIRSRLVEWIADAAELRAMGPRDE